MVIVMITTVNTKSTVIYTFIVIHTSTTLKGYQIYLMYVIIVYVIVTEYGYRTKC